MSIRKARKGEGEGLYKSFMASNTLLDYEPNSQDFEDAASKFKETLIFEDGSETVAFIGHQTSEPEEFSVFHKPGFTVEHAEELLYEFNRVFRDKNFLPNLDENGYVLRISSDAKTVFEEAAENYYHYEFKNVDSSVEDLSCERLQVVIDKPIGLEFRADTYKLSNLQQLEKDVKNALADLFEAEVQVTHMSGTQTLVLNIPYTESFDVNYFTSSDAVYTSDVFRGDGKRAEVVSKVLQVLTDYGISEKRVEFGQMIEGSLPYKTRETGEVFRPWD